MPIMKMNSHFKFDTFHSQFFVVDSTSTKQVFWSDDEDNMRLATNEGIISVAMNTDGGSVEGDIKLLEKEKNGEISTEYSYVVEGDLEVNSGTLQLRNCPFNDVELTMKVRPGRYRVRIYTIANNNHSDIFNCLIELWHTNKTENTKVLKR